MKRSLAIVAAAIALILGMSACQSKTSALQKAQQAVVNAYQQKLTTAVPYPVDQMNNSSERTNLKERLLRLNDPNKIGYLYGLSSTGQVMAFWTIKGKPSSMGSQLTITENLIHINNTGTGVVSSMGDDGSYGPEECAAQGVFAFTADSNALIEWCGPWFYSDAPLKLATTPLIVVDPTAKPTSTAGVNAPKP